MPSEKEHTSSLSMRDLSKIMVYLGLMVSLVAWVQAEFAVPKILERTAEQIRIELEEHSKNPHPVSASIREIDTMRKSIEASINSFKEDTHQRLARIEQKLDRL